MDPSLGIVSNHNLTRALENGKVLLEQLGLTSEVGEALKMSVKSMTDDE